MIRDHTPEVGSAAGLLAAIPIFDALINQLSTANVTVGPLSLLQAARALELAFLMVLLIWALTKRPRVETRVARLLALALALVACIVAAEVRRYGVVSSTAIIGIGQLLYVLVLWLSANALCRGSRDGRIVLAGIAIGGLISASSVLFAFSTQSRITEAYNGVLASSGLFLSAKYLIGNWIIGGLLWMYLLPKRFRLLGMLAASLCFLSLFASYNRTGQVCLALSIAWLAYWQITAGRQSEDSRWVKRLVLVASVAVVLFILFAGFGDMSQRWADLADRDTAGSGRLLLWIVSLLSLANADATDVLTGTGFRGMFDIIESGVGIRVHTHSDLFDFLLIGGLCGLAFYALFLHSMWASVRRQARRASAHAIGVAALLTFAVASVLTGQLTQPTAMTTYMLAIVATGAISRRHVTAAR